MKNTFVIYVAKLDEMIEDLVKEECEHGLNEEEEAELHILFENRKHAIELMECMKEHEHDLSIT